MNVAINTDISRYQNVTGDKKADVSMAQVPDSEDASTSVH